MLGMFVGSIVGGYIPVFLGADFISFSSAIGNGVGGIAGIFIVYKLTEGF